MELQRLAERQRVERNGPKIVHYHRPAMAYDDGDMVAETNEQVPFATTKVAKISPFLHLFDPFDFSAVAPPIGIDSSDFSSYLDLQKERLINYIRGEDQDQHGSHRNRRAGEPGCDQIPADWLDGGDAIAGPCAIYKTKKPGIAKRFRV